MLALTGWTSDLIPVALFIAAVVGAILLIRSNRIKTNNTLADSAIASMTAANAALSSRLDLVEKDHEHCLELNNQRDVTIQAQAKRIDDLREDVTQRALVADFRDEARGWLSAIADTLKVPATAHPPLPTPPTPVKGTLL